MTIAEARDYFIPLIEAQQKIASNDGSPLVFVLAAATIEYLSKLALGRDGRRDGYIAFIRDWMSRIRPEYRDFIYLNNATDLPEQMYFILRCGLVHSFSFVPDTAGGAGRLRSVMLGHRSGGETHLARYNTTFAPDAIVLIAEDFLEEIKNTAELLFGEQVQTTS